MIVDPPVIGSSPRGRGTPDTSPYPLAQVRFIPARAGNAAPRTQTALLTTVHPRAGGERNRGIPSGHHGAGSSPRGRGTHLPVRVERTAGRFIPARAGNARQPVRRPGRGAVHPRARGERFDWRDTAPANHGSSPRGRGTLRLAGYRPRKPRFIPARAGNARTLTGRVSPSPVHPRAGGERVSGYA